MTMVQRIFFTLLLVVLVAGCSSAAPVSQGTFDSPDPAARLYAIRRAGDQQDQAAIPALVELLDSSDPTERFLAIQALDRITGSRLDYDPYATSQQRQPAVARWVAAAKSKPFVASSKP